MSNINKPQKGLNGKHLGCYPKISFRVVNHLSSPLKAMSSSESLHLMTFSGIVLHRFRFTDFFRDRSLNQVYFIAFICQSINFRNQIEATSYAHISLTKLDE